MSEQGELPTKPTLNPQTGFQPTTLNKLSNRYQLDLATLAPVLRSLLVTDGTISTILEAYFWEPIHADVVEHVERPCEADDPMLNLRIGDLTLRRKVILRGEFTSVPYVFGEALIVAATMPAHFRATLPAAKSGLGDLIARERLETYRELVAVERTSAADSGQFLAIAPDAPVVVRRYIIHYQRQPAICITEAFPENRYR